MGDRLEPSEEIPNIGQSFDERTSFPVTATFWRLARETLTRHRNPLFCAAIGMGPITCLTIDILHGWHFGPMLAFVSYVLWQLVLSGIWGAFEGTNDEALTVAVICLKNDLRVFYKHFSETSPGDDLTQVRDVTVPTLGNRQRPQAKFKAAETWGILLYCKYALEKYGSRIPNQSTLIEANNALIRITRIMQQGDWVLTDAEIQDAYKRTVLRG